MLQSHRAALAGEAKLMALAANWLERADGASSTGAGLE
jgi:hypothetical protein